MLGDAFTALTLPDGPGQAWGGGESMVMRRVRDALGAAGVEGRPAHVMGYWKHRGTPATAEDDG